MTKDINILNYILSCMAIIFIVYMFYKSILDLIYSVKVKSQIDNNYYLVRNTKNKQETADILATINQRLTLLLSSLDDHRFQENDDLARLRYRPGNITENISMVDTSYTINKGDQISFCISTRDADENVYDINKLMFVAIHELAHVGCKEIGHGPEFIKYFKYLLEKSIKINIYKYQDYYSKPEEYCGITLNSTPLNKN